MLLRIGDWLTHLSGWPRLGIAFLAGLFSAAAFAPVGLFPALLAGLAILFLLLDGASLDPKRYHRAAFIGWAFGFGQFLAGFYWIGYPFLVDPDTHGWQMPFALALFPGGLALFPAAGAAAAMGWWKREASGLSRIFIFTTTYFLAEWLRGNILTGFPWNLTGYGWDASLEILQSASVIGIYGLSLLTILFGASLALLFRPGDLSKATLPLVMTAIFALMFAGGAWRLASADNATVPGVRLRLVQPSTAQDEKYKRPFVARNWKRLLDLTLEPAKGPAPTHIIWPEAATPFAVARVPVALDQLAILTARGRVIMTGSQRAELTLDGARYFNSFYIFGQGGQALGVYDKHHLVPFGEYVPFAGLLSALGITKLTEGDTGFSAGPGNQTFDIPGAPSAGVLICYEILFPGQVASPKRPGWFINVTDDSWFGPSSGPRQHLLAARVRAIEEGIPVARAANTGISAVIDAYGRITQSLPLNARGVIDANLPVALPTPAFAHFGALALWLLWGGFLALAYTLGRKSPTG